MTDEKIFQLFDSLATDLSRSVSSNGEQIKLIREDVGTLTTNYDSLLTLHTQTASRIDKLVTLAEASSAADRETRAEIGSLRRSVRKISTSVALLLLLMLIMAGGVVYSQKTLRDEVLATTQPLNAAQQTNAKEVAAFRNDLQGTQDSIDEVRRSLKEVKEQAEAQASRLQEKLTVVADNFEKSRGESFSQFMTQRTRLTGGALVETSEKSGLLRFHVSLSYQSLSSAKSARPSAVLALPHDPKLDLIDFQILVKRVNERTLEISLASETASIQLLETFLRSETESFRWT